MFKIDETPVADWSPLDFLKFGALLVATYTFAMGFLIVLAIVTSN